jgi:chromosome segregation ATPase
MSKDVTQTMDLAQALQTLAWLDEERRKDKASIAALEERSKALEQQLSQLAAQTQHLVSEVAGATSLLRQAKEFEQTVSSYKGEMVFLLDQREETWAKERKEAERLRRIEFEALSDKLAQLEKRMQLVLRHDDDLRAREAEGQRLNESLQRLEVTVSDLGKRSDDRMKSVTYLEEQRRADNRRIADLEHDSTELRKKIEAITAKATLLDDSIQKQTARIQGALQELKDRDKSIEELRIADFQREQKMKQYLDQGEQVAATLEQVRTKTQGFIEQQQLVKRGFEKLEGFQLRQQKQQNEVAEMQRLSEDRLKRQWEEWQDKTEKAEEKRSIVAEERWRQQEEANAATQERLDAQEARVALHQEKLSAVWEARRSDAARATKAAQERYEAEIPDADEQLRALRGER